jgi:hypothetical protein
MLESLLVIGIEGPYLSIFAAYIGYPMLFSPSLDNSLPYPTHLGDFCGGLPGPYILSLIVPHIPVPDALPALPTAKDTFSFPALLNVHNTIQLFQQRQELLPTLFTSHSLIIQYTNNK